MVQTQTASCEDAAQDGQSSDDSYDSEEERFLARSHAARGRAAVRSEAAAQAELLAAYRQRQQLRHQLAEEALRAKLQQQHTHAWGDTGWEPGSGQGRPAGSSGAAGRDPWLSARMWLRALQQHERQWQALEAAVGERSSSGTGAADHVAPASGGGCGGTECGTAGTRPIGYAHVPWPPLGFSEYLSGLAALEQQQQQQQQQQQPQQQLDERQAWQRAQRRAYARACLRWHPDKFEARWGRRLAPEDRAVVLARVQEVSQGINAAWAELSAAAVEHG